MTPIDQGKSVVKPQSQNIENIVVKQYTNEPKRVNLDATP